MGRLLVCDLDMVVADNTERMQRAEKAKSRFRAGLESMFSFELENPVNQVYVRKGIDGLLENLFWQTAFTPDFVALDTLIEGADEALYLLEEEAGYHIVFLTSRIESMRRATLAWLTEHLGESVQFYDLIMKTSAFQFIKTPTWKAGMVQTLASLYGADDLLVVDDNPDVQKAILDAYPDGGDFGIVRVASSLVEALEMENKQ